MDEIERKLVGWLMAIAMMWVGASVAQAQRPRDNWDFKFKGFVIGAWWGPGSTEAEVKLYKEAGFNVVMIGRYMQLDDYGDANKSVRELDLAHKYGLWVMFDTYTKNDRPWGGKSAQTDEHPLHHPASLIELEWLYNRLGRHPALIGFMIGDDQGVVSERSADCTRFLHRQKKPHLMPWLCGWISPRNLADHNNPIANPQIYPTLYQWGLPADELARQYALSYAGMMRQCQEYGVIFWPMFNVCASDSLVRFPAYAALAYGAEGIWYFTYNGGAIQKEGAYHTEEEVRKALTPLYPVAKKINHRIAAWGKQVLGRTPSGLFGTAFGAKNALWPFKEDTAEIQSAEALAPPGQGKLIAAMSDNLLAGILTAPGKAPLAMVVDCRTSKNYGDLPDREVTLRFAPGVIRVDVLEGRTSRRVKGCEVKLVLESGGGQMIELHGKGLDALCSAGAIYAPPLEAQTPVVRHSITEADLTSVRAAKLRIDVFGSNPEAQFSDKFLYLNGHRLCRVPASGIDSWSMKVIDLAPDQLTWIRKKNEVTSRTECEDAWKFRNLTLAVQLADGAWVKTNTDTTTYSTPDWAHSEGKTWGKDGVAGPIQLAFE